MSDVDAIKKIDKGDYFESIKESGLLKWANGICKTYYLDKKKTVYEINFTIYFKGYDDTSDDGSNFFFKSLTIDVYKRQVSTLCPASSDTPSNSSSEYG